MHTHMTNTRITDAEVFERRYPVLLRDFSLRPGSGGKGQHCGGDGVIRDIEFRIPVQVSILSERRVYHPYGLKGGEEAQCGQNIWVRRIPKKKASSSSSSSPEEKEDDWEERQVSMGAKNTAKMQAGERIIVKTPGGGGYGAVGEQSVLGARDDPRRTWKGGSLASRAETQETSM